MRRTIGGYLVAIAVGAVLGFVAGRASGGVDDPRLRVELEEWKRDVRTAVAQRDSGRTIIDGLRRFVASVNAEAETWRTRALVAERKGDQHQRRADSLLALLATAPTPRDSNAILVNACTERGLECAAIREANAGLKQAAEKDGLAKVKLGQEIAEHMEQRARDSAQLVRGVALVRTLEKAVRGCRLPLVGLPCPVAVAEYSLDDRAFRMGGAMPLKLGPLGRVMLSITTKVAGGRTP